MSQPDWLARLRGLEQKAKQLDDGSPEWNETTNEIVRMTCDYPPNSKERRTGVNTIWRIVIRSHKLWKAPFDPGYDDALSKALEYCFKNLCEAVTANDPYDPEMEDGNILRWVNTAVKRRLMNEQEAQQRDQDRLPKVSDSNYFLDISSESANNDDAEQVQRWINKVIDLIRSDPTGEFRKTQPKKYPHVNAQGLLLARITEGLRWKQLEELFKVPFTTLSSFYEKKCKPLLLKKCQEEGIPRKPEDFYE
jgi:hypothetical protein